MRIRTLSATERTNFGEAVRRQTLDGPHRELRSKLVGRVRRGDGLREAPNAKNRSIDGGRGKPPLPRLSEAQKYLNQGMIWIQGFNHDEAIPSFLKAAALDPKCAWAWWGVAYCEGPNYNDPHPDDNRSRAAWYALQNALARIENASDVERDLIIALKSRYSNPWPKDRSLIAILIPLAL